MASHSPSSKQIITRHPKPYPIRGHELKVALDPILIVDHHRLGGERGKAQLAIPPTVAAVAVREWLACVCVRLWLLRLGVVVRRGRLAAHARTFANVLPVAISLSLGLRLGVGVRLRGGVLRVGLG